MRTTVESIAKVGRIAQGVHVMNVGAGDRVAEVAIIDLSKQPPPSASVDAPSPNNGGDNHSRRSRGTGRGPRRR